MAAIEVFIDDNNNDDHYVFFSQHPDLVYSFLFWIVTKGSRHKYKNGKKSSYGMYVLVWSWTSVYSSSCPQFINCMSGYVYIFAHFVDMWQMSFNKHEVISSYIPALTLYAPTFLFCLFLFPQFSIVFPTTEYNPHNPNSLNYLHDLPLT